MGFGCAVAAEFTTEAVVFGAIVVLDFVRAVFEVEGLNPLGFPTIVDAVFCVGLVAFEVVCDFNIVDAAEGSLELPDAVVDLVDAVIAGFDGPRTGATAFDTSDDFAPVLELGLNGAGLLFVLALASVSELE